MLYESERNARFIFNHADMRAKVEMLFEAGAVLDVQQMGTYTGFDRILEYFVIGTDTINSLYWGGGFLMRNRLQYDWAISTTSSFPNATVAWSQINKIEDSFDSARTSSYRTTDRLFKFSADFGQCSPKFKALQIAGELIDLFVDGPFTEELADVTCARYSEFCVGPTLSEFATPQECASYLDASPGYDFKNGCTIESGRQGEGNGTFCKNKHMVMATFDPEHHCPHSGRGLPDDFGNHLCVAADCAVPNVFPPDDASHDRFKPGHPRSALAPDAADSAACYRQGDLEGGLELDPAGPARLSFDVFRAAKCIPDGSVVEELILGPPTVEGASYLASSCDASEADRYGGDEVTSSISDSLCTTLAHRLYLDLTTADQLCRPPPSSSSSSSSSTNASAQVIARQSAEDMSGPTKSWLRVATKVVEQHRATCSGNQTFTKSYLRRSCTDDDVRGMPQWGAAGLSDDYTYNAQFDSEGERLSAAFKLVSAECRIAVHASCASAVYEAPGFCQVCFGVNANSSDSDQCTLAVDQYRNESLPEYPEFWWVQHGLQRTSGLAAEPTYPGNIPKAAASTLAPAPTSAQSSPNVASSLADTPYPAYDTADHSGRSVFDYIVVGAGNAGCVVARRLSDAGHSVLVLEKGVDWRTSSELWTLSRRYGDSFKTWETPLAHQHASNASGAASGRAFDVLQGTTLGGSTTINSGMYSKPSPESFNKWPQGWGSESAAQYYAKFEDTRALTGLGQSDGHNAISEGAPRVPLGSLPAQHRRADMIKAARRAGHTVVAGGSEAASRGDGLHTPIHVTKNGERQDAFSNYLAGILPRNGLEIRTRARVTKLRLEDAPSSECAMLVGRRCKRAASVAYMAHGISETIVAYATKEVILAAGYVETPKLLLLSGIGNATELDDARVDVELDLPAVGRGLRGRPLVQATFGGSTLAPEMNPSVFRSPEADAEWSANRTGVHNVPVVGLYGQIKSQLPPGAQNGASVNFSYLMELTNRLPVGGGAPLEGIHGNCALCLPKSSTGAVKISAPDPLLDPTVDYNFLAEDQDVEALDAALVEVLKVLRYLPGLGMDLYGLLAMDASERRDYIRQTVIQGHHGFGTCAIGEYDSSSDVSVVDPDLRVRGTANIRVVDASIIAEPPCSGPMSVLYMIGEHASDMILSDADRSQGPPSAFRRESAHGGAFVAAVVMVILGVVLSAVFCLGAAKQARRTNQWTADSGPAVTTRRENVVQIIDSGVNVTVADAADSCSVIGSPGIAVDSDGAVAVALGIHGRSSSYTDNTNATDVPSSDAVKRSGWGALRTAVKAGTYSIPRHASATLKKMMRRATIMEVERSERRDRLMSESPTQVPTTRRRSSMYSVAAADAVLGLEVRFKDLEFVVKSRSSGAPQTILGPLDGTLKKGSLNFIVGASGSGKSTLLKVLCQRPVGNGQVKGTVEYGLGNKAYHWNERTNSETLRRIGYMSQFQQLNALPYPLTVQEALVMHAALLAPFMEQTSAEITGKIESITRGLGLDGVLDVLLDNVSGGQLRRVAIATHLLGDPYALFLDEPTSGLDATTGLETVAMLRALADNGMMVCLTIHQPRCAILDLADQIIMMGQGGVEHFKGTGAELNAMVDTHLAGAGADEFVPPSTIPEPAPAGATTARPKTPKQDGRDNPLDVSLDLLRYDVNFEAELAARIAKQKGDTILSPHAEEAFHSSSFASTLSTTCWTTPVVMTNLFYCTLGPSCSARAAAIPARFGTPIALAAVYIIIVSFLPGSVPLEATSDLSDVLGALLVHVGVMVITCQVDYTFKLVVPEAKFAESLYLDGIATRMGVMLFWITRALQQALACAPAYLILHFGIGFRADTAITASILHLLYILLTMTVAGVCSLIFGDELAPVIYGVYIALQMLLNGFVLKIDNLPVYWSWLVYINPTKFLLNGLVLLEFEGSVPIIKECKPFHPYSVCPAAYDVMEDLGYKNTVQECILFLLVAHVVALVWFTLAYTAAHRTLFLWCCGRREGLAKGTAHEEVSSVMEGRPGDTASSATIMFSVV